tara:strand:- start:53553 stop:54551 length:999 start_codon:yes stop_codon:yes gene_type:complete
MTKQAVDILLANPRGFCAGVDRAIDIVEAALLKFGAPVYVRHEVVHNRFVVAKLKESGAIFVDELCEVPDDNIVIFSAHGVSQAVREEASSRDLRLVLDATCPLVTKVHMEVMRQSKKGHECILIGHAGHAEVEGTLGQYRNKNGAIYLVENTNDVQKLTVKDAANLYYMTQTTLSVDETKSIIAALKNKFPLINGPKRDDICYATQNRQDAVRELAKQAELVLVVGSVTSSNSNRLKELAEDCGVKSYLIDDPKALKPEWLYGVSKVGVTAGASAPEVLTSNIIQAIKKIVDVNNINEVAGTPENMIFSMPKEIRSLNFKNSFHQTVEVEL